MNRLQKIAINLALVVGSVASLLLVAKVGDHLLGSYLWNYVWPGRHGVLYLPNTEDHYDMHDYKTVEYVNSLGFRDKETPLKSERKYRIAAIGDSFVFGWGSNIEDCWIKVLERKLQEQGMDLEILNFGKNAGGPGDYADIARTIMPLFKPDMLLIGVLGGDDMQQVPADRDFTKRLSIFLPNSVRLYQYLNGHDWQIMDLPPLITDAEAARKRNVEIARQIISEFNDIQRANYAKLDADVLKTHQEGGLNPWLLAHSTGAPDYFMNTVKPTQELEATMRELTKEFAAIRKAAKNYGARVLILNIPEGFHVNQEAYDNVQRIGFNMVPEMLITQVPDNVIGTAAHKAGLPFRSFTSDFRQRVAEKGLYLELDRHLTQKGNALLGELAVPFVAKEIGDAAMPE